MQMPFTEAIQLLGVPPDLTREDVVATFRRRALRTLVLPEAVKQWSLTTLRQRLVKTGAKVVRHSRSVIFQIAEVAVPRALFQTKMPPIGVSRVTSGNCVSAPEARNGYLIGVPATRQAQYT